jgi:methyltransferase
MVSNRFILSDFLPLSLPLSLLWGAVAVARVAELGWSRAHERRMRALGGQVLREPAYTAMVALHAGVLVAAPVEAWLRRRARPRRSRAATLVRGAALATLGAATALRIAALSTLGKSWSTRVTHFPVGARQVVTRGPYRFVRHPNYAAVILELLALPLAGGAWLTAIAASCANALVLRRRIAVEERELMRDPEWRAHFAALPRFVPRLGHRRRGPRA